MSLETRIVNNTNILVVKGDFTFGNMGPVRDAMKQSVASAVSDKFLVDLTHAGNVDSSGLGSLISIYKTVVSRKGSFGVIVPKGDLKEVFYTIGLNKLFPIFDDESQAL